MKQIPALFIAILCGVSQPFDSPDIAALAQGKQGETRQPRIEIVDLGPIIVDVDGETAFPVDVTYFIEWIPDNASHAEVHVLRDDEIVQRHPVTLQAGTHTLTIPAGLQMGVYSDAIQVEITSPTDKATQSDSITIQDVEQYLRRQAISQMRFDAVVPEVINVSASPQVVVIRGANMNEDTLTAGDARVEPSLVDDGLAVELPAEVVANAGFKLIRPNPEPNQRLKSDQTVVVAVADPTLPRPGELSGVRIDAVDFKHDRYSSGQLEVRGEGFERGMHVAIGRGSVLIKALDASVTSSTMLTVQAPEGTGSYEDFFITILSTDKSSSSRAFPIPAPDKMRAAALFWPDPVVELLERHLRVSGDLIWNQRVPQSFLLEAPFAQPGMRVRLSRDEEEAIVEAEVETPTVVGAKLPVVRIPVPDSLLRKPEYSVVVIVLTK